MSICLYVEPPFVPNPSIIIMGENQYVGRPDLKSLLPNAAFSCPVDSSAGLRILCLKVHLAFCLDVLISRIKQTTNSFGQLIYSLTNQTFNLSYFYSKYNVTDLIQLETL